MTDAPYRNADLPIDKRVDDLLGRMELEDKAGLMFQPMAPLGTDLDATGLMGSPSMRKILDRRISHVNILQAGTAREIAQWHNDVQRLAADTPLGIPVTVASDPRHSFSDNPLTALLAGPFSQWPEFLGFGALDDAALTREFAETVRREYLAVGIRTALHPQIDLATEPRWARASGTFGESAEVASRQGVAYTLGLQGDTVGSESVSTMAKHFPGGGPQLNGEDPHFAYGREQVYPAGQFELHLQPFRDLIDAGVAQLMPYYGMPVGTEYEEVGFSFNKQIIQGLLRDQLGYDGIVCSDWGILSRTPWGVESLSFEERMIKALDAGIDQFGGEFQPGVLVDLVRRGLVEESRLDVSVRRLLREKFRLGLFENPYVDVDAADALVGTPEARAAGLRAQSAAVAVLVNGADAQLPLAGQPRVYAEGLEASELAGWANVVASPADADVAIVRTMAPWEPRTGEMDGMFHAGSLDFHDDELEHLRAIAAQAPLILDVYLDRPAILAPVLEIATTVTVNFGASGRAYADVLFGAEKPVGRLPFDIPSSMAAVEASAPDAPFGTANPTFRFGDGIALPDAPAAVRPDVSSTTVERSGAEATGRYDLATVTLAELLSDDDARAIVDAALPGASDHPMLAMVAAAPFDAVVGMIGSEAPADLLESLRAQLSALPVRS